MTINEDALAVTRQVQADVAPGVSGWVASNLPQDEGKQMRAFIHEAQTTLGMEPNTPYGREVRNLVYHRIIFEIDPSVTPETEWPIEQGAAPGTMLNALNATETYFEGEVADEGEAI